MRRLTITRNTQNCTKYAIKRLGKSFFTGGVVTGRFCNGEKAKVRRPTRLHSQNCIKYAIKQLKGRENRYILKDRRLKK